MKARRESDIKPKLGEKRPNIYIYYNLSILSLSLFAHLRK